MKQAALITGGSRGIGLGIAREMAVAGFDLAINGTREKKLVDPVLRELASTGNEVIYVRGDISRKSDRQSIYERVVRKFSQLNMLVNNAGISPACLLYTSPSPRD